MTSNGRGQRPIHVLEILGNAIVGGMERYVSNLLAHLPRDEFQITLLAPFESMVTADLRAQGFEVFVTAMESELSWRALQATVALVRSRQVDLIHAHLPQAHLLGGISGALTGRPVVATLHGMSVQSEEWSIHRTTGTHLIVVCQQAQVEASSLGVSAGDLTLIYNGVDAGHFHPEKSGAAFRQKVGIPAAVPLVGFAGRLSHEKGPDIFLQAVQLIVRRHDEVHFVLVGTGPMEDELQQMIRMLDLEERVHLAGLWENMAEVYPAFDLLVQTSRQEGTPLVLLEAMAAGLPIVAIGVGGVVEIVEVGSSGLLSGRADWAGVGDNVLALLQQSEKRKEMGLAARRRVLEHFTVQESTAKTANLFRSLVRTRRRPVPDARRARTRQQPSRGNDGQ